MLKLNFGLAILKLILLGKEPLTWLKRCNHLMYRDYYVPQFEFPVSQNLRILMLCNFLCFKTVLVGLVTLLPCHNVTVLICYSILPRYSGSLSLLELLPCSACSVLCHSLILLLYYSRSYFDTMFLCYSAGYLVTLSGPLQTSCCCRT